MPACRSRARLALARALLLLSIYLPLPLAPSSQVREALLARAVHLATIGDFPAAEAAFALAESKSVALSHKLDLAFRRLRVAFFVGDHVAVAAKVAAAHALLSTGGDWEGKNRLKVYEGLHAAATRDFPRAATLLLDTVSTFVATEVASYESLVFTAVVSALVALGRVELKKRVVDSPEVRSAIGASDPLEGVLDALYGCQYAAFFRLLGPVCTRVSRDWLLAPHARHVARALRAGAFAQFLESYQSVALASMAAACGISKGLLDSELAALIASGRLPAKIDRVAGVIETTRPDAKSAAYGKVLKQGDLFLNKLQKLANTISMS